MPKSTVSHLHAPKRKRAASRQTQNDMKVPITAKHETERQRTISALYSREHGRLLTRDAEFISFIRQMYDEICPGFEIKYRGASKELLHECASRVHGFVGVNKASNDGPVCVVKRFDLEEGKCWADQRRSKWIVPLCVSWLDAIRDAIDHLKSVVPIPITLMDEMIVKLLTATYRPSTKQSNITQLVCGQTVRQKPFRAKLAELSDLRLPERGENIQEWAKSTRQANRQSHFESVKMQSFGANMLPPQVDPSCECGSPSSSETVVKTENVATETRLRRRIDDLQQELQIITQQRDYFRSEMFRKEEYIQQRLRRTDAFGPPNSQQQQTIIVVPSHNSVWTNVHKG